MLLRSLFIGALFVLAIGCAVPQTTRVPPKPFEVIVKVEAVNPTKVKVETQKDINRVMKSMDVPNVNGSLSNMSSIMKDEAFIKLFSSLTVGDVSNLHNDITYLYKMTKIRNVTIFINSPGGDAFSGLALSDQIERAKRMGFTIKVEASGIVASAAVPVFAVGTKGKRYAAPGTIFMVHETSIWKWPGRETASDIRSQNRLMILIRDRYIGKLVANSNLSKEEWEDLERKTTWFSSERAKEMGLVDHIQ